MSESVPLHRAPIRRALDSRPPLPPGCVARAGINIALVKYWGKRDVVANLPAVSSLSLTLDAPGTRTAVRFAPEFKEDLFVLDDVPRHDPAVVSLLDAVRAHAGRDERAEVHSVNTVPTASGLASSASGMAALGLAAWGALGLPTDDAAAQPALVEIIRRGSGSAPRSLLGGLVELDRETGAVVQRCPPQAWDLALVLAIVTLSAKKTASRDGMAHCAATSPYYESWVAHHPVDLGAARAAITARDLPALGGVTERSTRRMHACMWAADPALRYFTATSLALLERVEALRDAGVGAWATMDAGPHVKVLCAGGDAERVAAELREIPGLVAVRVARPGPGARVESAATLAP